MVNSEDKSTKLCINVVIARLDSQSARYKQVSMKYLFDCRNLWYFTRTRVYCFRCEKKSEDNAKTCTKKKQRANEQGKCVCISFRNFIAFLYLHTTHRPYWYVTTATTTTIIHFNFRIYFMSCYPKNTKYFPFYSFVCFFFCALSYFLRLLFRIYFHFSFLRPWQACVVDIGIGPAHMQLYFYLYPSRYNMYGKNKFFSVKYQLIWGKKRDK